MTVYVDDPIHLWKGKKWCHLFADDLDELHDFAKRLGMLRGWFQKPPRQSWPHYDITAAKRTRALGMGAVAADRYTTILVSKRIMVVWSKLYIPDSVAFFEEAERKWIERIRNLRENPLRYSETPQTEDA